MAKGSDFLIAYGFGKDTIEFEHDGKKQTVKIEGKTPEDKLSFIRKKRDELGKAAGAFDSALEKAAEHETIEASRDQMMVSDYPKPIMRYFISLETPGKNIEEYYFWCLNMMGDSGFPVVDKIQDVFTASEHSSFYGSGAQRLNFAQDRATQYLATIGKMVKDLFQIVRELRIIDEHLELYYKALGYKLDDKKRPTKDKEGKYVMGERDVSSEIALKGMWVDMIDGVVGGQRTGANIFTMAQQLQFTSLPDLFFNINPKDGQSVDKAVAEQAKDFNEVVKNAIRRKLAQYLAWRDATFKEHIHRRQFTIKYLRQHYDVIKLYMAWLKPFLNHAKRLSAKQELLNNPRLIAAFESSLVEIEVLGRNLPQGNKNCYACLLMNFEYETRPQLQFQAEGYQRGPIHLGTTRITWRNYAWTMDQIKNYKSMRERMDFEALADIDTSLREVMNSLGDDLMNYINEVSVELNLPKEEKKKEKETIAGHMKKIGEDVKATFGFDIEKTMKSVADFLPKKDEKAAKAEKASSEKKKAAGTAKFLAFLHYNIFKKAHGLLSW